MSTPEQKFILALNNQMVLHFAKAVDGTKSVELAPATDASMANLIIFKSAAEADGYKDQLCRTAAAQELPNFVRGQTYTPYSLETYCALTVKPFERTLEAA